jgi:hypothetical protein
MDYNEPNQEMKNFQRKGDVKLDFKTPFMKSLIDFKIKPTKK